MTTGKAGLVTGAAGGIGRGLARRLAADGGAVVVADLESARAGGEETVRLIRDEGGRAEFFACDVTRESDHEALTDFVVDAFGSLDFACNNAGVGVHELLADTDTADFDRTIAVNLRGTFLGMKHQIRRMRAAADGAIVNTSSNAGLRGVRLLSAYTASKHGILGLTKNAALEYADDGIRVNAVCPGAIETPLSTDISAERQAEIVRPQAMQRLGTPDEVAAAVSWLCSDAASFVTGAALPVDAGSVAGW